MTSNKPEGESPFIRLTFDWSEGAYLLRPYADGDEQLDKQNKVYITLIMFTEANGHIVARLRNPFGSTMLMGVYKDQTFEWSDEILHNVEVHVDIACKICMWCEDPSLRPFGLWRDESVNYKSYQTPHRVTPGELHNRIAESIYQSAYSAIALPGTAAAERSPEEVAFDVTRNVLGTLSGRGQTLPAFKLVVDQSPANVKIRSMAWGDRFTNGDEVKLNSTSMVRRVKQFQKEIAEEIQKVAEGDNPRE